MKTILYFLLIFVGFMLPNLANSQSKNINCASAPDNPGWKLVSHDKGDGVYLLDPAKINLQSFEKKTPPAKGSQMVEETKGKALNACVADQMMKDTTLIPKSWRTKEVGFPATIFEDSGGNQFFRCIKWDRRDGWCFGLVYLNDPYEDKVVAIK
ncbi:MAG: hypothetical protein WCW65_00660 [Candidatus Paceibacterota bacterium]